MLLLDLALPDSAGDQTLMRARSEAAHLPIVVLTGAGDDVVALEAVRQGIQDYLVKGQTDGRSECIGADPLRDRTPKRAEEFLRQTEAALRESEQPVARRKQYEN